MDCSVDMHIAQLCNAHLQINMPHAPLKSRPYRNMTGSDDDGDDDDSRYYCCYISMQCPTISAIVDFRDSDRQSCADETRLWQRYVGWFTDQPTESPPVGSQRCSSVDRRSTSLRSPH